MSPVYFVKHVSGRTKLRRILIINASMWTFKVIYFNKLIKLFLLSNLKRSISFNGNTVKIAIIEIVHINHGINKKTGSLNTKKRSDYTVRNIEKFIMLLDGEEVMADDYKGKVSKFSLRMNCPFKGRFFEKEFLMIFDTHYDKSEEIHTITLIPGW